jgi:hypothetical protein
MLIWAIVTLACIGYFLSQAVRAPIIEDDEDRPREVAPDRPPDRQDPSELARHEGRAPSLHPVAANQ